MQATHNAGAFSIQLKERWKFSAEEASEVLSHIALELLRRTVLRTPVDTGRLRGNWIVDVDVQPGPAMSYEQAENAPGDLNGEGSINREAPTILGWDPLEGTTLWISNNMPYALKIEFGDILAPSREDGRKPGMSKQAPEGMLRPSIQEVIEMYEVVAEFDSGFRREKHLKT